MKNYPVTLDQVKKLYLSEFGTAMPKSMEPFWDGFVAHENSAYRDGVTAGMAKARSGSK